MSGYNTDGRQKLIEFLKIHSEEPMTISEIYELISRDQNGSDIPAQSSVYRLIRKLVEEGSVKQTYNNEKKQAAYFIQCEEKWRKHLHMKCSECGKIFHLSEETSRMIKENILKEESFELNSDTMLTGRCENCK